MGIGMPVNLDPVDPAGLSVVTQVGVLGTGLVGSTVPTLEKPKNVRPATRLNRPEQSVGARD